MHHTRFTVTKARQWLDTIRPVALGSPRVQWLPKVIGSFRRQHEFVAEEIILHCFRDAEWSAEKLGGYTGDGGIDGICAIDDLYFLIQVKRYQGNINPTDVEAFAHVIAKYARKHPKVSHGFFIHSGKTGKLAKETLNHYRDVILISGNDFVDFILTPGAGLEKVLERKIRYDSAA